MTFDAACEAAASFLDPSARRAVVRAAIDGSDDAHQALEKMRGWMHSNVWTSGVSLRLDRMVEELDRRTRAEGLHALHDWDGLADRVNPDTIPVDVLNYLIDERGSESPDATTLSILVDYYALHLLALISLRAWDDGDAGGNLGRLAPLLDVLQESGGSGQRFVDDVETLLLVATSHYELNEQGYDVLLDRVRTLQGPRQVRVAIGHASSLGCHLRFGFEATYARDVAAMRDDNVADYPWLCFSLARLFDEYGRLRDIGVDANTPARASVVEALLNGLSADAGAFTGRPPAVVVKATADWYRVRDGLHAWGGDLVDEFEAFQPVEQAYSPLSFFFNFSHNVIKGSVVDALLWSEPRQVSLNGLLTALPRGGLKAAARAALATTLMTYARANPHRIRGRLMPVIVYDPFAGRRAFSATMRTIREGM
jgi:hypothetical protein